MLNELKKCDSIESIISMVADYYSAYDENNYIPAIYKEGSLIDREGYKSEFFAKLIIRPCNMDINESWLKGNDEGDFIDGSSNINASNCVYNLVLSKKYYQNFIYTFNPCLYFSNSYIYEKVQDHKKVANLVFFDKDFSTNEWPVLISNNDDEILLLKQSLKDFINTEVNVYPKYNLSVEFEYRDKEHILVDRNSKKGENYYINNKTDSDMTWINGTLDIEFKLPDYNNLNIITNKISGGIRPINENNWNDDMDAGLIVFKKSCLKMLKKRYIVLELEMIDLFTKDSTLIDILDDKVVFWEGEFNQLPYEVKKELEPFNIKRDSNDIISPPMFEWQLKGNVDYDKFEPSYLRLSKIVFEEYFDLAFEMRCNLDLPNNNKELINRINNINTIFNISFDNLLYEEKGFFLLKDILSNKYKAKKQECIELYDYYCYLILGVIKNDKEIY